MHFNADRILMDTRTGVRDPDRGNTVRVHPSKDGIEVALLDIHTGDWDGNEVKGTFEEAVAKQKASFERMYASLPSVPMEFAVFPSMAKFSPNTAYTSIRLVCS